MSVRAGGPVYVVDDDDAVRDSVVFLLEVEGFAARGFANAGAFLDALPQAPSGCVVSDMHMAGPNGLELLRILTERGVRLPVILMTGQGSLAMRREALAAGAVEVIDKPAEDDAIIRAVRAALSAAAKPSGPMLPPAGRSAPPCRGTARPSHAPTPRMRCA